MTIFFTEKFGYGFKCEGFELNAVILESHKIEACCWMWLLFQQPVIFNKIRWLSESHVFYFVTWSINLLSFVLEMEKYKVYNRIHNFKWKLLEIKKNKLKIWENIQNYNLYDFDYLAFIISGNPWKTFRDPSNVSR